MCSKKRKDKLNSVCCGIELGNRTHDSHTAVGCPNHQAARESGGELETSSVVM